MSRKNFCLIALGLTVTWSACLGWTRHQPSQPTAILIQGEVCASCEPLEPSLRIAFRGFENAIALVRHRHGDRATPVEIGNAMELLQARGLPKYPVSVGSVILIDRHGHEAGKLVRGMSVQDMRQALQALAAA